MENQISTSLKDFYKSAPVTSSHIMIGLGLSLFDTNPWKFHPFYFYKFQIYRGISNFLVTGDNLADALGKSFSLAFNSSLEITLKDSNSKNRFEILGKIHGFLKKIVKNPYLRAQVISGITILLLEFILFKSNQSIPFNSVDLAFLLRQVVGVSLVGVLDASMKWIWTFMNSHRKLRIGDYQIHPVWIPVISAFVSGIDRWSNAVKGFIAAVVVAEVMNLRNSDGDPVINSALGEIHGAIASLFEYILFIVRE